MVVRGFSYKFTLNYHVTTSLRLCVSALFIGWVYWHSQQTEATQRKLRVLPLHPMKCWIHIGAYAPIFQQERRQHSRYSKVQSFLFGFLSILGLKSASGRGNQTREPGVARRIEYWRFRHRSWIDPPGRIQDYWHNTFNIVLLISAPGGNSWHCQDQQNDKSSDRCEANRFTCCLGCLVCLEGRCSAQTTKTTPVTG